MKKQLWNTGWTVAPGVPNPFGVIFGSEPEPVPVLLPQDEMIKEPRRADAPSGNQTGYYPVKSYTYTKSFLAPADWSDKTVMLEFEGVMARAKVLLNGELVAQNRYGYGQFLADLTPYLKMNETNTVQVLALSNENGSRWYPGAGIYRDVWLHTGDSVHIQPEGVRLTTKRIGAYAVVGATVRVQNSGRCAAHVSVRVSLQQSDGTTAARNENVVSLLANESATASMQLTVDAPRLWSPEEPNLYTALVEVCDGTVRLDSHTETFGIRTLTCDAREGLCINGKSVKLRGACIHHDNGIIGATTLPDAERFRMEQLKNAGFNAIRSAHHPAGKALLKACDELGILVMDELTDIWELPKNSADYSFDFAEEWRKAMAAMVAKDYNHPSVVLYSLGNEIAEIGRRNGGRRNREMANTLRSLDPTRFVTGAISGFLAMTDHIDEMVALMNRAEAALSEQGKAESSGSEALNAAMSRIEKAKMDLFADSDELSAAMEEVSCELDVVGYNYLTGRHENEHLRHPDRVIVGSETYPTEIARLWDVVERNPHVIGDFTWTGYDYLGEAGIASYHYAPERHEQGWFPDRLAYCGDINLNAARRPVSYLREIAYGLRHTPVLAVERVNRFGQPDNTNDWKYADALDSWTFHGWEGRPTRVHVLSDADEVELLLNGESLGRKQTGKAVGFDTVFDAVYQPGTLTAIAYRNGVECEKTELVTAGEPAALHITASTDSITADGRGLALLTVDLIDANGVRNAWDNRLVTVTVKGAATLAGFGSADPSCEGSYQESTWKTFDGRVMAAVRSNGTAGPITVCFHTEGIEDAVVTLWAK